MTATWHTCHHCYGARCEVCEEQGGWFETPAEGAARLRLWGVDYRPRCPGCGLFPADCVCVNPETAE